MLFLLSLTLAAPPEFTVVNKCPPAFTVVNLCPAPAVAPARAATFRNGDWHAGHDCPRCGRQQLTVHAGGKYGPHTHRCPVDGTVWRHGG